MEIPIAIFFDDGVGAGSSLEAAKFTSFLVRSDFSRCRFEINHGKSNWKPMNKFSRIGYNIDRHSGFIFANDSRVVKLCSDVNDLCVKLELSSFVHVKVIAYVVGQIISSVTASCGNFFPNYGMIFASHYHFSPFLEFCCFRAGSRKRRALLLERY